jgi:predicted permease
MRLYRLLLRCFPPSFRHRFGGDMAETFADRIDRARPRGRLAVAAAYVRGMRDTIRHGLAERRRSARLTRRMTMWEAIGQDLRFGLRTFRRSRGTAVAAVVTLAIGMGMSTAVFSVSDALVMRALPYPLADRLVSLTDDRESGGSFNVALPNFDDWRASVDAIEVAAAWTTSDVNLVGATGSERVRGVAVTGEFFALVGAAPFLGRTFDDDAGRAVPDGIAVLSERAWRRFFGGRRAIDGATVRLDGVAHEVIGVVRVVPGFVDVDVWRPLPRTGGALVRRSHAFRAMARLREGVSLDQARAQLAVVSERLAAQHPDTNKGWRAGVTPWQAAVTEDLGDVLVLVGWIAAAVLIVAATNVAGLLVARAADRQRELAVRAALGASRRRVLRQLLIEHAIVSVAGAGGGLLVAALATGLVVGLLPADVVPVREPGLSGRVLAFAGILAVVIGAVLGVLTARAAMRQQSQQRLRDAAVSTSAGGRRVRQGLVLVQLTVASALLVGVGLLASSLWRAVRVDPGVDPRSVLTFMVTPARTTHADAAALDAYYESLLGRLAALPEVEASGATSNIPMSDNETISTVRRPDEPAPKRGEERFALHLVSTPGYMRAIGSRILGGRDFTDEDRPGSEPVAIVNESLARDLWPDGQALGRTIVLEPDVSHRVVGLVADTRHFGLDQTTYPAYWVPRRQTSARTMGVALRLRGDLPFERLRDLMISVDPAVPLYRVRTLEELTRGSLAIRRSLTAATAACGVTVVLLAVVGLYGVVASGVRDRRREIGIRLALGATAGRVVGLFLRRATVLSMAGVGAGLVMSLWTTSLLEGQLFGIEPLDPPTMAACAAGLALTTLAANWWSARQAARVDPIETLRAE